MTEEELNFEFEQAERLGPGNKKAGYLVETKTGFTGRTFRSDELVNGKQLVYCDDGQKLLCTPETLTLLGYID